MTALTRPSILAAILLWIAPGSGSTLARAAADTASSLYRCQTIVTGQGEENRGPAMVECFKRVLVKVSGDPRLMDDAAAAAMAGLAATFVETVEARDRMAGIPLHDEQGTRDRPHDLIVGFDPARIDAALRELGRAPWSQRPRLVALVAVRRGDDLFVLSRDGGRGPGMDQALAAEADRFGMTVLLPPQAVLTGAGFDAERVEQAGPAALDALAEAAGGEMALAGTLAWSDAALGWVADWRLSTEGRTYSWQVSGVNFDQAFRSAIGSAARILSGSGEP